MKVELGIQNWVRTLVCLAVLIMCSGACFLHLSAPDSLAQNLKVDVNLVNVFATVQDDRGEFVTGLTADDFRVYDDDVLQEISTFEKDDQVESAVAILLDNSGSMVDILPLMTKGTLEFAQEKKRLDDLTVFSFGTTVRLIQDFGGATRDLESRLATLRPYGTSVLFDALIQAMEKVGERSQTRKALIVFTDGNDNGSSAGFGPVSRAAQRSGVLIYIVAIGARVLVDEHTVDMLAAASGGRVIYMTKTGSVRTALNTIRAELAKQYYLGYYVSRRPGPHRIRVEIPGKNFRIRAKAGYTE